MSDAETLVKRDLQYKAYSASDEETSSIIRLISSDLTEPYSIITYRYFLTQWPELCFLCSDANKKYDPSEKENSSIVACIVSKVDRKSDDSPLRGYIAMLAVDNTYRYCGIGTELVKRTLVEMQKAGCSYAFLETPVENKGALRLYENLGFMREKRLVNYYMGGEDAFRLKLDLTNCTVSY